MARNVGDLSELREALDEENLRLTATRSWFLPTTSMSLKVNSFARASKRSTAWMTSWFWPCETLRRDPAVPWMVGCGGWGDQGKPSGEGVDLRKSVRAGTAHCVGEKEKVLWTLPIFPLCCRWSRWFPEQVKDFHASGILHMPHPLLYLPLLLHCTCLSRSSQGSSLRLPATFRKVNTQPGSRDSNSLIHAAVPRAVKRGKKLFARSIINLKFIPFA